MRKRLLFILICLVSLIGFANEVRAVEEDHSLNYDVE